MLKVINVGWFGQKLEKRKPSSAFSHQFLYCYAPALLINFQIYRRRHSQGPGYVVAFCAMGSLL